MRSEGGKVPSDSKVVKPSIVLTPQFLSHDQELTKELQQQHVMSVPSHMRAREEGRHETAIMMHKLYTGSVQKGETT
ncbi:acyl-coenzyme A synthetase ACSM1, mitochondrial-like isoform X2 [Callithrix jacchus]